MSEASEYIKRRERLRQSGATESQLDEHLAIEATQADHEIEKAYMAKERQAIVAWLRSYGGAGNEIAQLIEDGTHWKEQP